jgi:Mn-dependent DtxR family transcriptional regulator
MGQIEVYEYVKNNPNCTSKDIADDLGLSRSSVSNSLARLRKYEEIEQKLVRGYSYSQFIYFVKNEKPIKIITKRSN